MTSTPTAKEAKQPTEATTPSAALMPTVTRTMSTVNNVANLRAGPGTEYEIVGTAQVGQELTVIGRNASSDWYQLDNGLWIAAFLVDNAPHTLPIVI
jgi:uncharacterized protein YgiM (DUF1202 family)